ncbi:MAG TPA: cytochrome c [Noviherbaspirillum sp.]|uniref:c-type cytochrome n=1 Tax=Noviherbaspirillum sp. TaxID=1926288 RepID=UPI002D420289|nr:cytochrome c [Noviherbaspirillum sp.]HYD93891.1 cytochrome c [Noviherbaspirillum sp.]
MLRKSKPGSLWATAGPAALAFACSIPSLTLAEPRIPEPEPARRSELITLVRQDCGSCHGLSLKGGLGPALLPETLKDKPADSLVATIMQGRPGTAMPPWQRFMTEAEAEWVVMQLQKGFPSAR